MATNNNIAVILLKKIRALPLINGPIRFIIKGCTGFGIKVRHYFTIHWPVSGVIALKLPANETVKLYSKGDDFISTQVFWKGYRGYEGASIQLFYHLSKRSTNIIDIGANTGYFTLVAASANTKANVHSFEPIKRIYKRLEGHVYLNNLTNVTTVNSVAGNSIEPVKFYSPKGKGMALAGSTKKGWATGAEEIIVSSTTIDIYKKGADISKIDLIKMDCEFHEIEVLKGMKGILQNDKPIILMEVLFPQGEGQKGHFEMVVHLEIEKIMKENGYHFYLISEQALIMVDKLEYNPDERNYLFSTKSTGKIYNSYSEMGTLLENIF